MFFSSTDNPQQDLLDTFPEEKSARNGHFHGTSEDENGKHLNPTDFRAAADVPDDINPLDEEKGDPIMSAGIPYGGIHKPRSH